MELSRRHFLGACVSGVEALALGGCDMRRTPSAAGTQEDASQEMLVRRAYAVRAGEGTGIRPAAISVVTSVDVSSLGNLTEDDLANLSDEEFVLLLSRPGEPVVPAYQLSSSDDGIARVGGNGLVEGVSAGTCTIEVLEDQDVSSSATLKVLAPDEAWSERDNLYRAALDASVRDAGPTGGTQVAGSLKCAENTRSRIDGLLAAIVTSPTPWMAGTSEHSISSFLATTTADEGLREASIRSGLAALASEADAAQTTDELLSVSARWNSQGETSLFQITIGNDPAAAESDDGIDLSRGVIVLNELSARLGRHLNQALLDEGPQTPAYRNLASYVDCILALMGEPEDLRTTTVPLLIDTLARISIDRDALVKDERTSSEEQDEVLGRLGGRPRTFALEVADTFYPHLKPSSYLQQAGYVLTGVDFVEVSLPAQLVVLDELVAKNEVEPLRELLKFACGATYGHYTRLGFKAEAIALDALENVADPHDLASLDAAFDLLMGRDIVCDLLDWDLAALYAQNFLQDPLSRVQLKDLCERLKEEYISAVDTCPWLSDKARVALIERLAGLGCHAIGPETYHSYVCSYALRGPAEGGTLFDNLRLIRLSNHNWCVANVGAKLTPWMRMRGQARPVATPKTLHPLDPSIIYDASLNCITVCAGMVDESTFVSQDSQGNLGRIGWLIARELSRAIDYAHVDKDARGRPSSMLTVSDRVHFEDVELRMTRLFSSFCSWYDPTTPAIFYQDGNLTLAECLADNAGMDIVLRITGRDVEPTERQRVLTLVAQSIADVQLSQEIATAGPYPTPENRINVTVAMFDEYYQISGVTQEDAMFVNPAFRLAVWR